MGFNSGFKGLMVKREEKGNGLPPEFGCGD